MSGSRDHESGHSFGRGRPVPEGDRARPLRRDKGRSLGWLTLGALAGYALWWEPAMRMRAARWTLKPPEWRGRDSMRLVIISDLHAGAPHIGLGRVSRIVERANALNPDVAILLGDYSAAHPFTWGGTNKYDIGKRLADFHGRLGTWGVLGNHDWWQDAEAQARRASPVEATAALRAAGIPVLINQSVKIGGDRGFWLIGIDDQRPFDEGPDGEGADDLARALTDVTDDAPAVLLAHEPDIFPLLGQFAHPIPLTISGHTHGGQIRIAGSSPLIMASDNEWYSWGQYHENGRTLIVSGGIGCSVLPMRVGVPPEITVIDLIDPDA